ncbi:phosphatase PAP2 family protein [Corynebacterium choanae]|uniref:Major phosphate-irrepressible acid phosphatase n=1 Tax=Corynebacterium choanae TaxID=1862358 RepID=A0A3G6JDE6_9CORY|nr:phosphatase PAP2 family protein [Corynebacterium choanae]AZA14690.1 Major phosphate-irrepressible acid phosphatase precursor [Corynebacterium choanae]
MIYIRQYRMKSKRCTSAASGTSVAGFSGFTRRIATVLATLSITAGTLLTPVPSHADVSNTVAMPTPQPFPITAYLPYLSDRSSYGSGVYSEVLATYPALQRNEQVMASNVAQVVAINNNASAELVDDALADAATLHRGVLDLVADGLGPRLGSYFLQSLNEGRLPKTQMMFGGVIARAGGVANSTGFEKLYFATPRPFVAHPDLIRRHGAGDGRIYKAYSPSFPSGHTNQATWPTTLLAVVLPELAPQLLERGSRQGYHRLVLGVHYPLDVIGGRMTGMAAAADRWNDPVMREHLRAVGDEIRAELSWRCGKPFMECFDGLDTTAAVSDYTYRLNYDFAPIADTHQPIRVPVAAPDLLLGRFPNLDYDQRAQILAQTALASGLPLDDPQASWQRLNLSRAMTATVRINPDHTVTVLGDATGSDDNVSNATAAGDKSSTL